LSSRTPVLVLVFSFVLLGSSCPGPPSVSDIGQTFFYGQVAWPSIHRDARNSDFSPFVAPAANRIKWEALDGATTLLAPATGPEGNLYVTTGQGPGTSHLHAFDRDGNLLWQSAPQSTLDDLDSRAVSSSPLVDRDGFVYVSDANQFWSFTAEGEVRWVAALPPPDNPAATGANFISSILTNEGFVGGINADGKVGLFQRDDGSAAVPVFAIPKGDPPPGMDRPGIWAGGLMDPTIIREVEDGFFGDRAQVANTPAVDPWTGRIWITAAGPFDTVEGEFTGRLYGLDIVSGALQIGAVGVMGGGSGTSPAISPDGTRVYAADGNGVMNAFDAATGARLWTAPGAASAASPGVGPDGTVYSGDASPLAPFTLGALDPWDGSTRWQRNYDALAAAVLPPLPPVPPFFPTGQPIARTNSVVSISAQRVWVALTLGYEFFNPVSGMSNTQPRATVLASIDPSDGSILATTTLRDTQEGLIAIDADGSLYVSQAALLSSVFFFGVNPILEAIGLPAAYRIDGPPVAGVSALEPVSFLDHVAEGIEWVQQLDALALAELPGGDTETAFTATRRGRTQLRATSKSIFDAETAGEIGTGPTRAARAKVDNAERFLTRARNLLAGDPSLKAQELAALKITLADRALDDALDVIEKRSH